jgi:hypothetical protein
LIINASYNSGQGFFHLNPEPLILFYEKSAFESVTLVLTLG